MRKPVIKYVLYRFDMQYSPISTMSHLTSKTSEKHSIFM